MLKLKIPPPFYMLMMAELMWLLDYFYPIANVIAAPWNKLAIVIILCALLIDGLSMVKFYRSNTTINPLYPDKTTSLVVTGIYRCSRNPMYLGLLLLLVAWALFLGSIVVFIILPVFVVVLTQLQIIPEEQHLEQLFGQQYCDYKKIVRRWL